MVDQDEANQAKAEKAKVQGPVTAEEFAGLITAMSRFLGQFTNSTPFSEVNIGIGEWSLLNHLSKEPVEQRKLSRDLGVTKQRVTQICDSLKKSAYIEITPNLKDPRMNTVAITDAGKAEVAAVNARLMPVLIQGDHDGRKQRALHSISRSLRILKRVFSDPAGGAKKAKQLAAKAKA